MRHLQGFFHGRNVLHRKRHHRSRGPRAGPAAPGHVHRLDGPPGPPPPRLRGRRQLRRRGPRGPQRPHRGRPSTPTIRSRSATGARGIPVDAMPRHGRVRADGRPHEAPCRRQVRRRRLQGLRRPPRRRRLGRERALRVARRRGAPRRQGLPPGVRARRPRTAPIEVVGDARRHRHDDHVPARRGDLRGARHRRRTRSSQRLRETAFLTKGLHIKLVDERADGKTVEFHYEGGIRDFVSYINEAKDAIHKHIVYFEGETEQGRRRGRDAVERLLPGVGLHVRQQHQHDRGRLAPLRLPQRAHVDAQPQGRRHEAPEEGREARGRGRARRARSRRLRQAAQPAVRGPDEDEARQPRHRGPRPDDRQPAARRVPRGEPVRRARDREQGDRCDARAARRAQGARADAAQVGARQLVAAGQARRLLDPRPRVG